MEEGITVKDCTKVYHGVSDRVLAVANVSFSVPKGEIYCLMGPSGSGKTTLLNIISGYLEPDTGKVFLLGEDIFALPREKRLKLRLSKLGYVFQDFKLVSFLSAWENIALPSISMGLSEDEVNERLKAFEDRLKIKELYDKLPNELSYGERQRIAFVREIIKFPEVILADEPTSNLDIDLKIEVLKILRELSTKNKTTVLIASHDPIVLDYCSRAIYITNGTLMGIYDTKKLKREFKLSGETGYIEQISKLRKELIEGKITEEEFIKKYLELKQEYLSKMGEA